MTQAVRACARLFPVGARSGLLAAIILLSGCGDDTVTQTQVDASTSRIEVLNCEADGDCDDGSFCNGVESCEAGRCVHGDTIECDDAVECTADRCSEDLQGCVFAAIDADRDGHPASTCLDAEGAPLGDDCDDADPQRYPGNAEVCDGEDHDEDCDARTFGAVDADGDDHFNANCCNFDDDGTAYCGDDCDDSQPRTHPGNVETCDGIDNDCNGLLDHPLEDRDADGWATVHCGGADCDDTNADVYPGAPELCDGVDTDCSAGGGVVADEQDLDGDMHVVAKCVAVEGGLAGGDCDDNARVVNMDAAEACNALDDDCDGLVDEGVACDRAVAGVVASGIQSCVVRYDGTAACWGYNGIGRLGTGAVDAIETPRDVLDPTEDDLLLHDVAELDLGLTHTCVIRRDRTVSCLGWAQEQGEPGDGTTEFGIFRPTTVTGLEDVVDLAVGVRFACALRQEGTVHCWGDNDYGQLGDDTEDISPLPKQVEGLQDVVDISAKGYSTCAVTADGRAYCWGRNDRGQLGDATSTRRHTPVPVFGLRDAVDVYAGFLHTCARLSDDTVRCWGANDKGQLGCAEPDVTVDRPCSVFAADGFPIDDVAEVAVGGNTAELGFTCVLDARGRVYCFGVNGNGQMGVGFTSNSGSYIARDAVQLWSDPEGEELIDLEAVDISAGHAHACALDSAGTVWCWGTNSDSQLGDPEASYTSNPVPRAVQGL